MENHLSDGEFTLNLHLFSQVASFLRSIICTRKYNICDRGFCPVLLMTLTWPNPHTLPCIHGLPGLGETAQRPRVQGEGRVQSRAERRREPRPGSLLSSISGFPSPLLPQLRQETNCRLLDEKETLGHHVPSPYFYLLYFLMRGQSTEVNGLFQGHTASWRLSQDQSVGPFLLLATLDLHPKCSPLTLLHVGLSIPSSSSTSPSSQGIF